MNTLQTNERTGKNQIILDATEKIETVMGFDPQFQAYQRPMNRPEISAEQSASFLILWFFVLVMQALMFWKQK